MRTSISKRYTKTFFLACCLLLMGSSLQAQRWFKLLDVSVATMNDTIIVKDDKFGTPDWNTIESTQSVRNLLLFEINEDSTLIANQAFTYEAQIEVDLWMANDDPSAPPSQIAIETLQIEYDPDASKSIAFRALRQYTGAHQMRIRVISVDPVGSGWIAPAPAMRVAGEIQIERDLVFDCTQKSNFQNVPPLTQSQSNSYLIEWTGIEGAEEYDLEWTFYDLESEVGAAIANSTTDTYTDFGFLFQNNATRVTVNANSYEVQLLYPEGYVFFRLRSA
ncbi:MAG: hypothetical protein AAF990_14320, partial [Bacteroidota bacterium]